MKLHTLLSLSLLLMASIALGQPSPPQTRGQKSDEILAAMNAAQVLNQLLPLTLTKEQILKLLPVIEKVREKSRRIMEAEHNELLGYEKKTKEAVKNGVEKGVMPSQELIADIHRYMSAVTVRRELIINENVDLVLAEMKKSLHKGQITVAAKSLTLAFYAPEVKPEDATEDFRVRLFIRYVLLDPAAYQMLIQMSKLP